MAAIVRRIFEGLRDEHMRRAGRPSDTNYTSRAEHFVTSAYLDLCYQYHHHELDTLTTSIVLSNTVPFIALPVDCAVVFALTLRSTPDGTHLQTFVPVKSTSVFAELNPVSGVPRQMARHGSFLYFDRIPDQAYLSTLYYYKLVADPDFATGTVVAPRVSALKWVHDERILELSVARAKNAHWLPELAGPDLQLMTEWMKQTPETLTVQAAHLEQPQQRGDSPPGQGPLA